MGAAFQTASPNGGVLVLSVTGEGHTFERLIFLKPKAEIGFSINFGKDGSQFMPGEKVNVVAKLDKAPAAGETFYASVLASDLSSVQNPEEYVMPSLKSMVYFEKEIKLMNDRIDIFPESAAMEADVEM